jgi:hypothetical protein
MFEFAGNVRGSSSHNFISLRIPKFQKILKKNLKNKLKSEKNRKCLCYYLSNGILNVRFFKEIRDQGIVNGLYMVLILKSETKVGGGSGGTENFFSVLTEKLRCTTFRSQLNLKMNFFNLYLNII